MRTTVKLFSISFRHLKYSKPCDNSTKLEPNRSYSICYLYLRLQQSPFDNQTLKQQSNTFYQLNLTVPIIAQKHIPNSLMTTLPVVLFYLHLIYTYPSFLFIARISSSPIACLNSNLKTDLQTLNNQTIIITPRFFA